MLSNPTALLSAVTALGAVLLLVWLAYRGARLAGFNPQPGRGRRIRILESIALDPRRRLHLLQWEHRQVLLLTGGGGDLVLDLRTDPSAPACQIPPPPLGAEGEGEVEETPSHPASPTSPQSSPPPGAERGISVMRWLLRLSPMVLLLLPAAAHAQALSIDLGASGGASLTSRIVQLTALIGVLSLAPSLLVMVTAFTRIVIVLSLLRSALSTQGAPPNMVLIGLALFLTFFVMQPVLDQAWTAGLAPMADGRIGELEGMRLAAAPFHHFMTSNLRPADLQFFLDLGHLPAPATPEDASWRAVVPAFLVGELRRAFEMGFLLFLPFLIIDMVVASVLMSLGMMMLPPNVVSLPFKLIFFVMVDGWRLVAGSLVQSFAGS